MALIDREKTGCEHCGAGGHEASDTKACRDEAINRLAASHYALDIACRLLQRTSAKLREVASHDECNGEPPHWGTECTGLADEIDKALGPVPT